MPPHHEQFTHGVAFRQADAEKRDRLPDIDAQPLVNSLETAFRWISRWRRQRSTVRELQHLSDHQLKDIGLDRAQIASSVDEMIDAGARSADRAARRQRWGL